MVLATTFALAAFRAPRTPVLAAECTTPTITQLTATSGFASDNQTPSANRDGTLVAFATLSASSI